jgi:hypothetical protein
MLLGGKCKCIETYRYGHHDFMLVACSTFCYGLPQETVHELVDNHMDTTKTLKRQPRAMLDAVLQQVTIAAIEIIRHILIINKASKKHPFLEDYPKNWVTHELIKQYLKNKANKHRVKNRSRSY